MTQQIYKTKEVSKSNADEPATDKQIKFVYHLKRVKDAELDMDQVKTWTRQQVSDLIDTLELRPDVNPNGRADQNKPSVPREVIKAAEQGMPVAEVEDGRVAWYQKDAGFNVQRFGMCFKIIANKYGVEALTHGQYKDDILCEVDALYQLAQAAEDRIKSGLQGGQ